MPNRKDASMIKVFIDIYKTLKERKWNPKLHVLNKKCSKVVKKYILSKNTNIQIVEPHNHQVNVAEPAVKCAKYHTIAGLATVAKECPIELWD